MGEIPADQGKETCTAKGTHGKPPQEPADGHPCNSRAAHDSQMQKS